MIPQIIVAGFPLLHISSEIYGLESFFDDVHSKQYEVIPLLSSDLPFCNTYQYEGYFHVY